MKVSSTIAIAALVLGFLIPSSAAFASSSTNATRIIGSSGGRETFSALVRDATTCAWSSTPKIARFAKTVKCATGDVQRTAKVPVNHSGNVRSYSIKLVVHAIDKSQSVHRFKVKQAASSAGSSPSQTTTIPPTVGTSPTAALLISSNSIAPTGGAILLSYVSTNATSCSLTSSPALLSGGNPQTVNCTGSTAITVNATTTAMQWTFTFTATNSAGQSATSMQTLTQSSPTSVVPAQSSNWGGYIVSSGGSIITETSGQFTVPTLKCSTKSAGAAEWVGIGGVSGTLLQTGVETDCASGAQQDVGWWEEYPSNPNHEEPFTGLTISPGDSIVASVYQDGGSWLTRLDDLSTGLSGWMVTGNGWGVGADSSNGTFTSQGSTASLTYSGGTTAEWIVEDYSFGNALIPFANFGTVSFSNLTTSLPTWALTGNDAVEIYQNSVLATPSSPSGSGFSISYTGP